LTGNSPCGGVAIGVSNRVSERFREGAELFNEFERCVASNLTQYVVEYGAEHVHVTCQEIIGVVSCR
jgi:hypothetical protein